MVTLRKSFWLLAQFGSEKIFSAIAVLLLARILGPDNFGLSSIAVAIPSIFIGSSRAIVDTIMSKQDMNRRRLDEIFAISVVMSGATLLICALFSVPLYVYFDGAIGVELFLFPILAPVFAVVGAVPEGIINRRGQFRLAALRKIVGSVSGLIVSATVALSAHALFAVPAFFVFQALAGLVFGYVAARWWPTKSAVLVSQLQHNSDLRLILSILSMNFVHLSIPRIAEIGIGTLAGTYYSAAFRVSIQIVEALVGILVSVSENLLLNSAKTIRNMVPPRSFEFISDFMFVTSSLYFGLFFGIAMFSKEIFNVLLKEEWSDASSLASIYSCIYIFSNIDYTMKTLLKIREDSSLIWKMSYFNFMCQILAILLVFLLLGNRSQYVYVGLSMTSLFVTIAFCRNVIDVPLSALAPALLTPLCFYVIYAALVHFIPELQSLGTFEHLGSRILIYLAVCFVSLLIAYRVYCVRRLFDVFKL
jgi:O-antigen/teichoic acid export membrane protein